MTTYNRYSHNISNTRNGFLYFNSLSDISLFQWQIDFVLCLFEPGPFDISASEANVEHLKGELRSSKAREETLKDELTGLWITCAYHHIHGDAKGCIAINWKSI